ncbi:iron chelate uptake ABC transporter family permease subunit [Phaeobacter sp. QD34_3]|uniref:iron chelate uptake ABC transporter family permease subunit n=1 Tax=unclassified Phaeobacter TaxID=2621772 RepID=UPI00237F8745|nr:MULTISPECIES: iron chelate uptake ABC transporter family permease subunit [unclassified Phaeobacter]MDE4134506.1 iron chelate uptake ABC transporter family permease subunit [Phaeobacter sp. QD34_3]MDE4138165.1 iron chelate uptake ABC transporter family permease subunit [Phaeobacter sp. QD34_24]MDE4176613.1 iron chelate uptake ABC transporter family permease subunit [Phaeobacter sp. PT47_59]
MLRNRMLLLVLALILCCLGYLLTGVRGSWAFALEFRGLKLAALLLVGAAQAVAAIMFQTITGNRILTPSIMGFDALYLLILSGIVFAFGAQAYQQIDPWLVVLGNAVLLCAAAVALFGAVLRQGQSDLMRMVLTGVVLAVMLRSITSFLQRMIDPNEYAAVQAASFARFSRAETDLLALAALLSLVALAMAWRLRFRLDVLALGPTAALSLGENPLTGQRLVLLLISVLVAVSTALVGPVAFFGLLVTALTYVVLPTHRHAVLLPGGVLMAGIVLVGGQWLMERVMHLDTPLSVVVEFLGGLVFLLLLLKGLKR